MNKYSILPLVISVCFLLLGSLVYFRSKSSKEAATGFFISSFVTFLWQFSWYFLFNTEDFALAQLIAKIGHVGIALIPASFSHYYLFLIDKKKYRAFITVCYGISAAFIVLLPTDLFVQGVNHFYWGFYPKAGILHPVFLFYLFAVVLVDCYFLFEKGRTEKWRGISGEQIKFLCISMFIYSFASSDFLVNYGVEFYPLGIFAIFLSLCVSAYAIVKYRLMDIRVAVTSAGLFLSVYTLVLGGPLFLGYHFGYWKYATFSMFFLATIAPFIFLRLQRRVEEKLLREQRRYQSTLIQASSGMGRIRDLKKLLGLIVRIVTRAVRVEHSAVYVYSKQAQAYLLGSYLGRFQGGALSDVISVPNAMLTRLKEGRAPLLAEEIARQVDVEHSTDLADLLRDISSVRGMLVVPSLIENRLIGFLVLGAKLSKRHFTSDDISVFTILANQAALAIENALFYEDMQRTQEQLFKAEKMATIGIMADGLSHQINNRLHAMGFIAGDMMDTLNMKKDLFKTDELKGLEEEFRKGFGRLEENVVHGRNIVQGLMKYTRKGEEGFGPCDMEAVFQSAWEMAQFKVKADRMKIVKDMPQGLKVRGNFTQLQEVFFNLIDNAYDAMMQRKEDLQQEGYTPLLTIRAEVDGLSVVLVVTDNGIGVKDHDREKLFTPFFTTKATSRKGTGLGLYVIRKIVEENHGGRIEMSSRYLEGTCFRITLPVVV